MSKQVYNVRAAHGVGGIAGNIRGVKLALSPENFSIPSVKKV